MATLDVTDVSVIAFEVDTVVTAPVGGTYTAIANVRYGVPDKSVSLTVSTTNKVQCMTKGRISFRNNNVFQLFTVNELRTPV